MGTLIDQARGLRARVPPQAWMWLAPVGVAAVVRYFTIDQVQTGIEVLIALGIAAAAARWPERALLMVIAVIPFQLIIFSVLFKLGLPAEMARHAGYWKEAVVAGIVVAAVNRSLARGRGLDRLDRLCLVYVGFVTLYLLFPRLFSTTAPTDAALLRVAFRSSVGFVVLFVAARHLDLPFAFRRRLTTTLLAVGAVIGGLGVFEFLFSSTWNTMAVDWFEITRYKAFVLQVASRDYGDIRVYGVVGGREIIRVGSVFYEQLVCGLYLVIPFAIGIERLARHASRPLVSAGTALVGLTILFTQTRAAILAALLVALVALRPAPGRSPASRARFAVVLAAALAVAVPIAAGTGLVQRTTGAVTGSDESATTHIESTRYGIELLVEKPLGRGLGTEASTAGRFDVAGRVTSENYYLQVGNETGVHSMAVFIAILVVVGSRLRRALAGRRGYGYGYGTSPYGAPADELAAAWWGSFLGLTVAGLLLHVWLDFIISWTWWGTAGLLLAPRSRPATGQVEEVGRVPFPAGQTSGR